MDQTKPPRPELRPFEPLLAVWCGFAFSIWCEFAFSFWRESDKFRNKVIIKEMRRAKPPRPDLRPPKRLLAVWCEFAFPIRWEYELLLPLWLENAISLRGHFGAKGFYFGSGDLLIAAGFDSMAKNGVMLCSQLHIHHAAIETPLNQFSSNFGGAFE